MITLRGKRLFVEALGAKNSPALLYLHGGPGSGSYDFTLYQGHLLSRRLHLVVMDQRGVLRSDPLGEKEALGLRDIIKDCEALRRHLGIKRWSVLGHSFGGLLALRYGLAHPSSVECLIFENPTFDVASSYRSLLRGAGIEYRATGKPLKAKECLKAAESSRHLARPDQEFLRLTNGLGVRRDHLYLHGEKKELFFEHLIATSPLPPELWMKNSNFVERIFTDKQVYKPLLPGLRKTACPALLIKGRYDWVTSDDQLNAFSTNVQRGRVVIFQKSAHFPHIEEPKRFADVVTRFVKKNTSYVSPAKALT